MRKMKIGFSTRYSLKKENIFIGRGWNHSFYLSDSPVLIEPYVSFHKKNNTLFNIGSFSYTHSSFPVGTTIGRYCSIAENVRPMGDQHPLTRFTTSVITYENRWKLPNTSSFTVTEKESNQPIIIGNDVWIGRDVVLKPGITIGNGAVIASNALVTKDVPPYAIVAGLPAKVIRYRFDKNIIEQLTNLKWWEYNYQEFPSLKADIDIERFISLLSNSIECGKISPYSPTKLII
ncbi:Streptogramin A acetyltransferase [Vibrio ruber DSM 16370]|uniref:Streptogramin A acetyltransferase n=1 Tax=Vibrio ruber (strain DSM 16370 / JCM 11486 / BCRC 17186 / CECT 7878 / LMG 23124 / VR1) TaxID=1123498 RepID=A0A1R4LKY0_VIBR1|nr:CatB-related O-acetyltransferase [Vibrio ruber]SJN57261.1 Streptogramin A acetyltransferase [Vibrio ruber DSM 16370]